MKKFLIEIKDCLVEIWLMLSILISYILPEGDPKH